MAYSPVHRLAALACAGLLASVAGCASVAEDTATARTTVTPATAQTPASTDLAAADGTVTEAQGYLFSRPVAAARIRQLLDASHGRHLRGDNIKVLPSRSIA